MKRILVIQDFCTFGKTSGTVSVSILSAMGIEAVFIPINIKFSNLPIPLKENENFASNDLSSNLKKYCEYFQENKITFDGIYLSGDFSQKQVNEISNLLNVIFTDDCFIITNLLCCKSDLSLLKDLYIKSNVLIININELSSIYENLFLDKICKDDLKNKEFVENILEKISNSFLCNIIVTGFYINNQKEGIVLWEKNSKLLKWFYHNCYNSGFYGLDDIFSAIIAGNTVKRINIEKSVKTGIEFVEKSIKNTLSKPAHNWYGADFESIILQLSDS